MGLVWRVAGVVAALVVVVKYVSHRRNPLSRFPGPVFASISNIPFAFYVVICRQPHWVHSLHEKYGPVVRIAPHELSFSTPTSWNDIYGYRKGHAVFPKSDIYNAAAFASRFRSIVNTQDPVEHARMRKAVGPAFSDRALRELEPLITGVVDKFIWEMEKRKGQTVDLCTWFSLATFDIIADLSFGQSFNTVQDGKPHPWVVFFMKGLRMIGPGVAMRRFPWLQRLVLRFPPPFMSKLIKDMASYEDFTLEQIRRRIETPNDQRDIVSMILERRDVEAVPDIELAGHGSDFVIAGTDTTAHALGTAVNFCLRDEVVFQKLKKEIREAFKAYDEISPATTANLTYLNAVLSESMRIFPPVPWVASRVVPPGGDTVDGHFLPGGTWVSTHYYSTPHSKDNFEDPWVFRPERWIDPGCKDKLESSQPFSMGTRGCIGKGLAWVEMRLILTRLVYRFDLELVNTDMDWIKDSVHHTLWARPPLQTKILPRAD